MKIRGLLLDVEGVLVADKRYQAVETAVDFIRQSRRAKCPFRLISNNTTDDRKALVEKLGKTGFDFTLDELLTCISAAVTRLRNLQARRCLVLGNTRLRGMFAEAGFEIVDDGRTDAVIVGLDTELTYARLTLACEALTRHKAAFVALHRNRLFPDAAGRAAPSVGAIVAAIEYATQVEPVVIGKPSPAYFQQALDEIGIAPADVLVVSDDPLSDLAGAKGMGMRAAFVLSGKYRDRTVLEAVPEAERPDLIASRIGDLLTTGGVEL